MTNKELWSICLESRKAKQQQLQQEISHLENQLKIADFEEDMYYRLAESRHKYAEILNEKQADCKDDIKTLEIKIAELKTELTVLEIEIEYLENLLK